MGKLKRDDQRAWSREVEFDRDQSAGLFSSSRENLCFQPRGLEEAASAAEKIDLRLYRWNLTRAFGAQQNTQNTGNDEAGAGG